jgi:hypothetical protein
MILQEICSQQPIVFIKFNRRLSHPERLSWPSTLIDEFGEIDGDIH